MQSNPGLALLAFLGLVLAGCSGNSSTDTTSLGIPTDDLKPSETTGCLRGVVVDDAIRPIAGANVTIRPGNVTVTSDATGTFTLCDLPEGVYFATGKHDGYTSAQTNANVIAGDVVVVRLQLAIDVSPVPYHVTYEHSGFMQAWGGIGQFAVESFAENGSGLCNCRIEIVPDGNRSMVVAEAFWDQTVADPAGLAEYYMLMTDPRDVFESEYCFSPCMLRVDMTNPDVGYTAGNPLTIRLDGPDAYVASQQPFELKVTLWYRAPAPEGWTIDAP